MGTPLTTPRVQTLLNKLKVDIPAVMRPSFSLPPRHLRLKSALCQIRQIVVVVIRSHQLRGKVSNWGPTNEICTTRKSATRGFLLKCHFQSGITSHLIRYLLDVEPTKWVFEQRSVLLSSRFILFSIYKSKCIKENLLQLTISSIQRLMHENVTGLKICYY